jgi:hypothetical protein
MKTHNPFFAGVVGGALMSLLATLARARGLPVDTELLLGTFSGGKPGPSEWISGFILSLLISGAIGVLYGQGFALLAPRAGVRPGLVFGFVHAICGGVLLEATTAIHPLVPSALPDTGTFLGNLGPVGLLFFFASHFAFGAVVGWIYRPPARETEKLGSADRPAGRPSWARRRI